MRCYLMRHGRIENVEFLSESSDERLIMEAEAKFREHGGTQKYDGFEVWVGNRFVFRFPPDKQTQRPE
jgi:hypothetical protein